MDSWFFKITDYAQDILDKCEELQGWPERVITMQKNWIGKSHGAIIRFPLVGSDKVIEVYTTRQDTVFGATFMCFAPEHPMLRDMVRDFCQKEILPIAAEIDEKELFPEATVRSAVACQR
jgi:leucyl-tRNA synthetase